LALALWLASAKLWMLQCRMIGLDVPPHFEILCERVKSLIELPLSPR
jgi:hypothetical protein